MDDKIYLKNDFVKKIYIEEFGVFKKQNQTKLFKKIYSRIKDFISKEIDLEKKSEYEASLSRIFPTSNFDKNNCLNGSRKLLNTQETKTVLNKNEAKLVLAVYNGQLYDDTQSSIPETLKFPEEEKKQDNSFAISNTGTGNNISILSKGQMELELFRIITNAKKELFFFFSHTEMKWLSNYIISIVGAKHKTQHLNINIILYGTNAANIVHSYRKLRLLKHLGCNIAALNYTSGKKIPFIGAMSDPEDFDYCKMLCIDNTNGNNLLLENDFEFLISPVFTILKKQFLPRIEKYTTPYIPEIIVKTAHEYIKLLQKVEHYKRFDESKFEIINFEASKIGEFFCHEKSGVKEYKIKQHEFFGEISNSLKSEATFAFKYFKNKHDHIINVPIVEFVSGKYYIVDGHTRLHLAYQKHLSNSIKNSTIKIVIINMSDHECRDGHLLLRNLCPINEYHIQGNEQNKSARYVEKETHTLNEYNWAVDFPLRKKISWTDLI